MDMQTLMKSEMDKELAMWVSKRAPLSTKLKAMAEVRRKYGEVLPTNQEPYALYKHDGIC